MITLPSDLTDDALVAAVRQLAADERTTMAALVAHLVELDNRRLAIAAGHSLFTYCREVLLLSEDAACNRIAAVRIARAYPPVLPMLADGRLNLSTLRVLAPHLTPNNHADLLVEAAYKSKRKVEELVAARFPQTVTTSIRRMAPARAPVAATSGSASRPEVVAPSGNGPSTTTSSVAGSSSAESSATPPATSEATSADDRAPADSPNPADAPQSAAFEAEAPAQDQAGPGSPRAPRRPLAGKRAVTPMAEDIFLIRLAATRAMVDRLRRAQDLLAHAVARDDLTEVFDRALIALIAGLEKRKFAATERPRRARVADATAAERKRLTRLISAAVRREVRARDGDQCAYVSADGRRCEARAFLEFHHLKPYEVGGSAEAVNIALLCRAHNQYEADAYFAPVRAALAARASVRPGADGVGSPGTELEFAL